MTDGAEQVLLLVAMERGLTNQHLVQQHTETPPVTGGIVLGTAKNLGNSEKNKQDYGGISIDIRVSKLKLTCLLAVTFILALTLELVLTSAFGSELILLSVFVFVFQLVLRKYYC